MIRRLRDHYAVLYIIIIIIIIIIIFEAVRSPRQIAQGRYRGLETGRYICQNALLVIGFDPCVIRIREAREVGHASGK